MTDAALSSSAPRAGMARTAWLALALLALAFIGRVFHSSWTSTRADYAGVPSPVAVATPAAFGLGDLSEVRFPRRGEAGAATVAAWYAPPAAAAKSIDPGVAPGGAEVLTMTELLANSMPFSLKRV